MLMLGLHYVDARAKTLSLHGRLAMLTPLKGKESYADAYAKLC